MGGVHSLVILPQELGAFALGQVPENDLGVIWILNVDRLSGHDPSLRPRNRPLGQLAWSESGSGLVGAVQVDGDSHADPYRLYIDNAHFYWSNTA
jgi:hypothetical protein